MQKLDIARFSGGGQPNLSSLSVIRASFFKKHLSQYCKMFYRDVCKRFAFTLAEVLITLGIIGVIAAMTLPALISNVQKLIVQTQLRVFNTTINNAFRLSQVDHGTNFQDWIEPNHSYSYEEMRVWLDEYLFPYIKHFNVNDCRFENVVGDPNNPYVQTGICFHMANGALVRIHIHEGGGDLSYFVNGKVDPSPRNKFGFQFAHRNTSREKSEFIEPYVHIWNGDEAALKTDSLWGCYKGCTNCSYCTKIIQLNNWEIPDDYPW